MMRSTRTLAFATVIAGLCGCGGFDGYPLTHGILRGTLVGAGPSSSAMILGKPELVAVPSTRELTVSPGKANGNWAFEFRDVPRGEHIDLLLFISAERAVRQTIDLEGGEVKDLGPLVGKRISTLDVDLDAPSHLRIRKGTVAVLGTTIRRSIELSETRFDVPEGCYDLEASVPGLGTKTVTGSCVAAGIVKRVPIRFDGPSGSPGREGCSEAEDAGCGCDYGYHCESGKCVEREEDSDEREEDDD